MTIREKREVLKARNRRFPKHLVEIPPSDWGEAARSAAHQPMRAWESKDFFAHLWHDTRGNKRLTVGRTSINSDGSWKDGITWDELQRLKSEAGFGACWAVECYPPDAAVIYDANLRHLWLLDQPPAYGWHPTP